MHAEMMHPSHQLLGAKRLLTMLHKPLGKLLLIKIE
jgi:hypothetical protein